MLDSLNADRVNSLADAMKSAWNEGLRDPEFSRVLRPQHPDVTLSEWNAAAEIAWGQLTPERREAEHIPEIAEALQGLLATVRSMRPSSGQRAIVLQLGIALTVAKNPDLFRPDDAEPV